MMIKTHIDNMRVTCVHSILGPMS